MMEFLQRHDIYCLVHMDCKILGMDLINMDFLLYLLLLELADSFGMDHQFHRVYNYKLAND